MWEKKKNAEFLCLGPLEKPPPSWSPDPAAPSGRHGITDRQSPTRSGPESPGPFLRAVGSAGENSNRHLGELTEPLGFTQFAHDTLRHFYNRNSMVVLDPQVGLWHTFGGSQIRQLPWPTVFSANHFISACFRAANRQLASGRQAHQSEILVEVLEIPMRFPYP
jgi:hypothetical protein